MQPQAGRGGAAALGAAARRAGLPAGLPLLRAAGGGQRGHLGLRRRRGAPHLGRRLRQRRPAVAGGPAAGRAARCRLQRVNVNQGFFRLLHGNSCLILCSKAPHACLVEPLLVAYCCCQSQAMLLLQAMDPMSGHAGKTSVRQPCLQSLGVASRYMSRPAAWSAPLETDD